MLAGMSLEKQNVNLPKKVIEYDTQFMSGNFTRALIQETATGRYLGNGGQWTADRETAIGFRSGLTALQRAQELKPVKVQLVLTRGNKICEVIPVMASDTF